MMKRTTSPGSGTRRSTGTSTSYTDIVVVGRTNRPALVEGSERGEASVTVVASREVAVSWVRDNLGPGDAVLYENDLPDHYP